MKTKLLSVAVALLALWAVPSAFADSGGSGGAQAGVQGASTNQAALGAAVSKQNAVNANVPVSIAGGNVTAGPSSATQTATSNATTDVSNKAKTDQDQHLNQDIGGNSGCYAGCGGAGGFQAGVQNADTNQLAAGVSKSDQNAVNANVPVSIAGGDVNSGPSSATQTASSTATTDVSNKSKTDQDQSLHQNIGGGSCKLGCGGAGGFQAGIQDAQTNQLAVGAAKSDQNAVNANVPVSIAGGNVNSGSSNATQTATSNATTDVSNKSKTDQDQHLSQNIGGGSCLAGCGGPGGFQAGVQKADTNQGALGIAKSDQNAVNANVPVSIAGGDVNSGSSNATQTATSNATTDVSNKAKTDQDQSLHQNIGDGCGCGPSGINTQCVAGCGGAGGFQLGVQKADTNQAAAGAAFSNQNAVNSNTPVSTAGGNIYSGSSDATQTATSNATTDVSNKSKTDQDQHLSQNIGGGSCLAGCGGPGGFQLGAQVANTNQWAAGAAFSNQNAVNGNAPVSTAGGDITSGSSNATQTATSNATTDVSNKAKTDQDQGLKQDIGGKDCGCSKDGKDGKDGHDGLSAGSGGAGGFQAGVQAAETNQWALGISKSDQNAVNSNAPVSTAGGNIYPGSSDATQTATSNATTDVSNKSKTDQDQWLHQDIGGKDCGCKGDGKDSHDGLSAGSGGDGGFQAGIQAAKTNQGAFGFSDSYQNAVNGNAPVSTAGGDITSGSSNATQTATSNATTDVSNKAKTDQDQGLKQDIGGKRCGCGHDGKDGRGESKDSYGNPSAGSGGAGGFQLGIQLAKTNQLAAGAAFSNQNAVNSNTPSSTAGGNIYADYPSSATQTATSNGTTDVSNRAKTDQNQWLYQLLA
jgi:hypothetical protein